MISSSNSAGRPKLGKVVTGITVLLSLFCVSAANATTLTANTSYNLNGGFDFTAIGAAGTPSYFFRGRYQAGSTLSIGAISGNTISSIEVDGIIDYRILNYDPVTNTAGAQVGGATASLTSLYSNLRYDATHDVAAGLPNAVSGGGLLNVTGTLNGQNIGFTSALAPKFIQFSLANLGTGGGRYDSIIQFVGMNFAVALGDNDTFSAWLMGNAVFQGRAFSLLGDTHATITPLTAPPPPDGEVPEPASVALLMSGLAGVKFFRKQKA